MHARSPINRRDPGSVRFSRRKFDDNIINITCRLKSVVGFLSSLAAAEDRALSRSLRAVNRRSFIVLTVAGRRTEFARGQLCPPMHAVSSGRRILISKSYSPPSVYVAC